MLTPIPVERLPSHWVALVETLAPALALDDERTLRVLARELWAGELMAFRITGDAEGYATATTGPMVDSDGIGFWVSHIGGEGRSPAIMRSVLDEFEAMARALGCDQIRIEGRVRGWSRIAGPEWLLVGDILQKELT